MKTKNATASRSSAATKKGTGNGSRGGGKSTSATSSRTTQASSTKTPTSRSQQASSGDATAQGLRDLFEDQLKDIFWAEKALTKAIPKMIKNATSEELTTALEEHLAVTEEQVTRLEEVFGILGKAARGKKCEAMEGLIKEGEEIMESTEKGVVRDAGIIAAAQKVEHYEIATYGTLCSFAKTLGENEAADLLEQTLMEEKEADETLTGVAESSINVKAAAEDDEEEAEDDEEEAEEEDEE